MTIAGLHVAGGTAPDSGSAPDEGGDILDEDADLIVSDAVISGGTASLFSGGFYHGRGDGIASDGAPLTLRSTLVIGNEADFGGGVEAGGGAELQIEGSTISGNAAVGQGAGASLWAFGSEAIAVRNSTVSGNTSSSGRGAPRPTDLPDGEHLDRRLDGRCQPDARGRGMAVAGISGAARRAGRFAPGPLPGRPALERVGADGADIGAYELRHPSTRPPRRLRARRRPRRRQGPRPGSESAARRAPSPAVAASRSRSSLPSRASRSANRNRGGRQSPSPRVRSRG